MTRYVKTAISIPDDVFRTADRRAKEDGVTRSELYVRALRRYLEDDGHNVTARLNEVYANEDSSADPFLLTAAIASLPREEW